MLVVCCQFLESILISRIIDILGPDLIYFLLSFLSIIFNESKLSPETQQDVVLSFLNILSLQQWDRDVSSTIKQIVIFLYHEVGVENIAIRFIQWLAWALLEYLFVDIYRLNCCNRQAILKATRALLMLFLALRTFDSWISSSNSSHLPKRACRRIWFTIILLRFLIEFAHLLQIMSVNFILELCFLGVRLTKFVNSFFAPEKRDHLYFCYCWNYLNKWNAWIFTVTSKMWNQKHQWSVLFRIYWQAFESQIAR